MSITEIDAETLIKQNIIVETKDKLKEANSLANKLLKDLLDIEYDNRFLNKLLPIHLRNNASYVLRLYKDKNSIAEVLEEAKKITRLIEEAKLENINLKNNEHIVNIFNTIKCNINTELEAFNALKILVENNGNK